MLFRQTRQTSHSSHYDSNTTQSPPYGRWATGRESTFREQRQPAWWMVEGVDEAELERSLFDGLMQSATITEVVPENTIEDIYTEKAYAGYHILDNGDIVIRFTDGEVSVLSRYDFRNSINNSGLSLCIKRPNAKLSMMLDNTHRFVGFDVYEYGRIVGAYEERSKHE